MTRAVNADPDIVRISLPTPYPVGPVNAFLVKGDEPTLIDAGVKTDEAWERLVAVLAKHRLAPSDIRRILLTHGHLDHVGLAPRLVEESGAETWAHPDVIEQFATYDREVEEGQRFLHDLLLEFGAPQTAVDEVTRFRSQFHALGATFRIDHALEDGQVVGRLKAHYVPGHSASDTLFYDAARRAAFTGDHVLKGVSPNPLLRRESRRAMVRARSLLEYQRSLRLTRDLDIETCYPGHGAPFGEHRAVINGLLERHERRTREVAKLLEERPMTPYEIVMRIFPRIANQSLHFALAVAVGHLDVLEDRGRVKQDSPNGVVVYRLAGEVV